MADDVNDHTLTYAIHSYSKYSELFEDIIHRGYFLNIFGNNVVWTLFCINEDLISWKTKKDVLYNRFVTEEPTVLNFICGMRALWLNTNHTIFLNRLKGVGAKHYTMSKYNADSIKTDEPNKMGLLKQGSGRFWT